LVLVALQSGEGVLEVFELDDDAITGLVTTTDKSGYSYSRWPLVGKGSHELVEELLLLLGRDLGYSGSHVQGVLAEGLVVGAQVDGEREGAIGPDTGAGSVQRQLAYGNTHAVDTEVSKTENARAVCEDGDLDLVRPVIKDLAEVATVSVRKVHALGLCPDLVPSYACLADSWGVNEGCHFLG
jgi:hypothetical protein